MLLVDDGNLRWRPVRLRLGAPAALLAVACVSPGSAPPPGHAPMVLSPTDGARFAPGQPLVLCTEGREPVSLRISSDVDGAISPLQRPQQACPEGAQAAAILLSDSVHTLSIADARDDAPAAVVTVIPTPNAAPACGIIAPQIGDRLWETEPVQLQALVSDDGPPSSLTVSWSSELAGVLAEPRARRSGWVGAVVPPLSPGVHRLQLSLIDPRGGAASCTTELVVDPCSDADGDGVEDCAGDCDDNDETVAPGGPELENGRDDDCDGVVDEDTNAYDDDQDGHTEHEGDCDDGDPLVYPGADDVFYDGVDSDCAGNDDFDADGDGAASADHGGDDCDDTDPHRYPGAGEIFYDGIDSDCAGDNDFDADGDGATSAAHGGDDCDDTDSAVFVGASELRDGLDNDCDTYCDEGLLQPGDLVITEIMANPLAASDSTGEWFEVANTTSTRITLCTGWTGTDDRFDSFTVSTDVPIDPGTPAVFVRNGDPVLNGGVVGDYTFGRSFQLAETDDQITLTFDDPDLGSFEMSRVAFDGAPTWPDTEGATLSLDPAAWTEDANDNPENWCAGMSPFGDGDLGTPGNANDGC